jgi:hypothetical protein
MPLIPKNATNLGPYVFAGDEAGDTSFRFDRGASTHFSIALIGTRDADSLRLALDQVRARFHLAPDFEFKFHNREALSLNKTPLVSASPELAQAATLGDSSPGVKKPAGFVIVEQA